MENPKIAVVGASGNVGRQLLEIIHQRKLTQRVTAVASANSAGSSLAFGEQELEVQNLEGFDFSGYDIVLSSAGGKTAGEFAPKAAAQGAVVIDNSSHFRMDSEVPLVVPEVNPDALKGYKAKGIIANPNCSTIQLVTALAPLHKTAGIKQVVAATYQSTSGAGKKAMDELFNQTSGFFNGNQIPPEQFPVQIAFNLIPQIDEFDPVSGATKEELKMVNETRKILGEPALKVMATCVRVPTFICHGIATHLELAKPLEATQARQLLAKSKGVAVIDERTPKGYVTPLDAAGQDAVYVSRIRNDEMGLAMWIVADNLRKGAALNAVQIAEIMVRDYL